MRFAEMTAPDLIALPRDTTLVVAPIAACEQHAAHLPVFTDSILCGAVADGVEAALPDRVLLLPVLWIGASEHHVPFGGTLTATLPTYEAMLVELLAPMLRQGFRRILLLNGHGGNIDPLHVALRRLDAEFPTALLTGAAYWELAESGLADHCQGPRKTVGHACEIETSMMMAIRPDLVRRDRIVDDPDTTPSTLKGLFWARDFGRRTRQGAVGHPGFADADRGRLMLATAVERVLAICQSLLDVRLPD